MHYFNYRNNTLYCEDVKISDIADKIDTPFYLYSHRTAVEHFLKLKKAFSKINPLICYSMKANSNLAMVKALVRNGGGLDIVSGGELYIAKRAGCPGKRIVYAGVGKTEKEIEDAINYGILLFNVESIGELELINEIAGRKKKKVNISLRINPDIEGKTHKYITTGKAENKFGLDFDTAHLIFIKRAHFKNLDICGVHVHIGSQITASEPFMKAFRKILIFLTSIEKEGYRIKFLNLGGGLGIIYHQEVPQTADQFAKNILPLIKGKRYKIVLEPGRFIVGNAGVFVTKVLYTKESRVKNFVIVDGGMNDLIRPALYDSYHEILPLEIRENEDTGKDKEKVVDVVGPICESGDFLAHDRVVPELKKGDLIAFLSAGAYGFSMSSNYNSRPRVAEVMVKGKKFKVVRKRETYPDLIKGETVPSFI